MKISEHSKTNQRCEIKEQNESFLKDFLLIRSVTMGKLKFMLNIDFNQNAYIQYKKTLMKLST